MFKIWFLLSALYVATPTDDQLIYGYTGGEPLIFLVSPIYLLDTTGKMAYLDSEAALYFRALVRFARAMKFDIQVTYGYRNWREQNKLWKENSSKAAPPGYSDHQTGLSVDIQGCLMLVKGKRVKSPLFFWMKKYGPLFGFINDIPSEPWHFTFVGHQEIR